LRHLLVASPFHPHSFWGFLPLFCVSVLSYLQSVNLKGDIWNESLVVPRWIAVANILNCFINLHAKVVWGAPAYEHTEHTNSRAKVRQTLWIESFILPAQKLASETPLLGLSEKVGVSFLRQSQKTICRMIRAPKGVVIVPYTLLSN